MSRQPYLRIGQETLLMPACSNAFSVNLTLKPVRDAEDAFRGAQNKIAVRLDGHR